MNRWYELGELVEFSVSGSIYTVAIIDSEEKHGIPMHTIDMWKGLGFPKYMSYDEMERRGITRADPLRAGLSSSYNSETSV